MQSNLVLKELAQEDIIVPNENKVYLFLKRLIDIVGSGLGILILIPVFLIIGKIISKARYNLLLANKRKK